MYARTRFDIVTIIGEEDNYYELRNRNNHIRTFLHKRDALKLSDKVEDLCDEFAIIDKDKNFTCKDIKDFEFAKDNCDFDRGEKTIGIITRYDGLRVKVAETNYYKELRPINSSIYRE